LLKVDFHTHTNYSEDSLTPIDKLLAAARACGLDRLVVTDHNLLAGALEAWRQAPELVIPGEEVQTTEGEFLAAFVTEEVPRGLEPLAALKRLRAHGAFISISNPFDPQRSGWSRATLDIIAPQVDAIETGNARVLKPEYNRQAAAYAASLGLPGSAGSDAHHHSEVGRMYTLLPEFNDAESLRAAMRSAQVHGRVSSPLVHLYSMQARMVKAVKQP